MAQTVLEVSQLVGQNRNAVEGQKTSGAVVPWRVFNLAPDRRGGYSPYGRRVRLLDGITEVTLTNISRLQGYDETGIATMVTSTGASGALQIFRGSVTYNQASAAYDNPYLAVHMDGAGAYISRDAFLVLNRDGYLVEPMSVEMQAVAVVGSALEAVELSPDPAEAITGVAYGNGYFIAVSSEGNIYRSDDKGRSWTTVDTNPGVNFRSIEYGNARFMAMADNAVVYYSTDDGDTWSNVTVAAGWEATYASWGGGDMWFVSGWGASGTRGIFRSLDGGLTWGLVDDLYSGVSSRAWRVLRIGVDRANQQFAGAALEASPTQTNQEVFVDESDGGASFNFASAIAPISGYSNLPNAGWSFTEYINGVFWVLNPLYGRIAQNSGPGNLWQWSVVATLTGAPSRARYNAVTNQVVVVGAESAVGTSPYVWHGPTASSLTRQTEIEAAISAAGGGRVWDVAFDNDGDAVYVASGGVALATGAGSGLERGTYNIYFVSYFNTNSGRFVFDITRQTLSFSAAFGNSVTFLAQGRDAFIAANPWLLASADSAEIAADVRVDVYIQYTPTAAEIGTDDLTYTESLAEYTIRYAFTTPLPDSPDALVALEREIGELPIGRQIVARGLPTTAVFREGRALNGTQVLSRTALHNGRMWGLASQDETRWEQGDGNSLEIANQFNSFVLTYTETGWANLVSDQSFIPIQPSQSVNFIGMVSTPSGLMVVFDNEIFLVTGDPAFGNVTVELYLDMAGGDVGSIPAVIGGIAFTVWDGKIWAIQAGQASEISRDQWLDSDPFVRVAAEAQTRSIMGLTQSGQVLRYIVDDQFWMTDPVNRTSFAIGELLPNCICESGDDTRFVTSAGEVWVTRGDGTPDTPHIVYKDMDFGFPEKRTALYMVKATLQGDVVTTPVYDRADLAYDGDTVPALFYTSGQENNGVTTAGVSPNATGGIAPVVPAIGGRDTATFTWRLPLRRTRYYTIDTRLELRGMGYSDVVRLPVRFFHSAGGETR